MPTVHTDRLTARSTSGVAGAARAVTTMDTGATGMTADGMAVAGMAVAGTGAAAVAGTAGAAATAGAAVRGAAVALRAVTGIDTTGRAFVTQRSAPAGVPGATIML
ncbi:hypothetical protein KBK24_0130965 [Burkholderia sp. K24]|nr:hypothetical protein KBK24_0130965 [Burkholderia sp. K24]